jgi:hypothetical protein
MDSFLASAHSLEGVWTIPVCDMSYNNWNVNYEGHKNAQAIPPCMCGVNGKQTADFLKAVPNIGSRLDRITAACWQWWLTHPNDFPKDVDYIAYAPDDKSQIRKSDVMECKDLARFRGCQIPRIYNP